MKQIILLFTLLLPSIIFSQIELKGKIKDNASGVLGANITLTNSSSKTVGCISDYDGNFSIQIDKGIYQLTISYIGYQKLKKEITLNENHNLGIITLQQDISSLKEVVITTRKKLIQQKADRIIFNVQNSIAAANGDALDALKVAPGLQIQNGVINMFGRGNSQVMINGRLLPLMGEELTNYLNSISGSDIQKIEVITAPPAKYEASGNGGLINIVLKKGKENSWKNTMALSHNINTYSFTRLNNSLLFNKNKINLSLSLDKTKGFIRGLEDFKVYYPNNTWDININTKDNKEAFSGRLLLDYAVSKKTTIGLQYFGNKLSPGIDDSSVTRIFNPSNTIDSLLVNNGRETEKRLSHSLNLHAIIQLDTLNRKLSFDADYFSYNVDNNRTFQTESFNAQNEFLNTNLSANAISNQSITNKSLKADMEHPLKDINLSYGIKLSSIQSQSGISFYNTENGKPELDSNISNKFEYDENNQAIYINASKKLNEKWQLQLGMRFENTKTKGFSQELNQTNKNDYSKIFPTFYATYDKDDNNTFSLSYSKRIQRPAFNHLNPFRVYVSSNTYSEGNPFLQPTFNDNFELKHTFKNKLSTNIFYNIKINASGVIFTSNIEETTQIVTRDNFFNQNIIGIGESYTFNKLKWLQSQNNVTLIHIQSKFTKPFNAQPQNGFSFIASSNNTIILNKTSKLQIDTNYNSKAKYGLFKVGSTFSLDLGYNKTFLNKSLNLSLLIKDVFATSYLNNLESTVNGVRQVYGQNNNNRYIRFSLSYSFGNKKINVKNRKFGNEEETRRAN